MKENIVNSPYNALYVIFVFLLLSMEVIQAEDSRNTQNSQSWKFAFDQPQTVWALESGDLKLKEHRYDPVDGYNGRGCEFMSIDVPADSNSVLISMKVGTGQLLEDVLPSVYIKSNRTGLRFYLRIILPMTATGQNQPLSVLLEGTTYSNNGRWQQLRIDQPTVQLEKQVKEIARQTGKELDITNAFFDKVYLDLNGGQGETSVWIDDIEITSFAPVDATEQLIMAQNAYKSTQANQTKENPALKTKESVDISLSPATTPSEPLKSAQTTRQTPQITISGQTMLINNNPFFLRAIRHRGEPLELLRNLGFNTVWLSFPPSESFQSQAATLGIWFICPAPLTQVQGDVSSEAATINFTPTRWGDQYYRVLAWDLGDLTQRNLSVEQIDILTRRIQECDSDVTRPIFAQADSELRNISRTINVFLLAKNPMYSTTDMESYSKWLTNISSLLQPGTPKWCIVSTQPERKLVAQWQAMFPSEKYPLTIPLEQLMLQTLSVAGTGNRGILFDSITALSQQDADTQTRCRILELINSQLTICDSFFAIGDSPTLIETSEKYLRYIMLTIPSCGRLLLPLSSPPNSQYVLSGRKDTPVSLLVPGIPVTYQAYRLTPNGLEPLKMSRQAGGSRIILEHSAETTTILLSRNPSVINSMFNRLRNFGPRGSVLLREITSNRLENFRPWFNLSKASKAEQDVFATAVNGLKQADFALKQRLYSDADTYCNQTSNALRMLEYSYWLQSTGSLVSPNSHPAAVSFRSMRLFYQWQQQSLEYKMSDNILQGGEFESLESFQQSKWNLFLESNSTLSMMGKAEISPQAAFKGTNGLRMWATIPPQSQDEILMLEKPPVTIVSPVIKVEPNETVKITCLVNLPQPIKCSSDGLIIREVHSGHVLQQRVTKTLGWQPIVMFRAADSEGNIQLSIELTGIGEAYVDCVKIARIVPRNTEQISPPNEEENGEGNTEQSEESNSVM